MNSTLSACRCNKEPEFFTPESYWTFKLVMLQQQLERLDAELAALDLTPRQKRNARAALAEAIAALENGRPRVQLRGAAE